MSDTKDVHAAIERLERENAELSGLILATVALYGRERRLRDRV